MADRPDALRGTLDHLKLDPKAKGDREYLASVLRRLGFSADELLAEDDRVVEVEFDPARPRTTTFEIHAAPDMGEMQEFILVNEDDEVFEFKLVEEEEEGPILDTGDWDEPAWPDAGDRDDEAPVPTGTAEDDWAPAGEGSDPLWPDARDDEDEDLSGAPPEEQAWGEAGGTDEEAPRPDSLEDDAPVAGDPLAWPGPEAAAETPAEEQVAWPSDETATAAPWSEATQEAEALAAETGPAGMPAAEAPYTHDEYTLCTRQIEITAGAKERIYFFAKQVPNGWEPCAIPAGFQVKINERNDLPYLERSAGA